MHPPGAGYASSCPPPHRPPTRSPKPTSTAAATAVAAAPPRLPPTCCLVLLALGLLLCLFVLQRPDEDAGGVVLNDLLRGGVVVGNVGGRRRRERRPGLHRHQRAPAGRTGGRIMHGWFSHSLTDAGQRLGAGQGAARHARQPWLVPGSASDHAFAPAQAHLDGKLSKKPARLMTPKNPRSPVDCGLLNALCAAVMLCVVAMRMMECPVARLKALQTKARRKKVAIS